MVANKIRILPRYPWAPEHLATLDSASLIAERRWLWQNVPSSRRCSASSYWSSTAAMLRRRPGYRLGPVATTCINGT
jgi:hypothetical protein